MPEVTTPQPPKTAGQLVRKKRARRKTVRSVVIACAVIAALTAGGIFLFRFLTHQEAVDSDLQSQPVSFGSIQSRVTGSGNARAKESAALTLTAGGTVREVLVSAGDQVSAGDPLYSIFSQEAQDQVTQAENQVTAALDRVTQAREHVSDMKEQVTRAQNQVTEARRQVTQAENSVAEKRGELEELTAEAEDLKLRAPFAGKLTEVESFTPGQDVSRGTKVATLVNDKQLRLSLYFSYAYEAEVRPGREAEISIPAVMGNFPGTVERVNQVNYITPEGGVHFEAVLVFDNPGTLTADMDASAVLHSADGGEIYPYSGGKTAYYEVRTLEAKGDGPVEEVGNLYRYADVSQGELLLTLGTKELDKRLRDKEKEIQTAREAVEDAQANVESALKGVRDAEKNVAEAEKGITEAEQGVTDARKKVEEAEKALENFNAVSPIDGTVTSSNLAEGMEVKSGETVMTISNTANMEVEISVDDRNISFVQPGMMVELTDWNQNMYFGVVSAINMSAAESSNGMTRYPVTLSVDNSDGSLLAGMYLDYSFVASQSDDCLLVPMQSVKYVSDTEGETYSVVFIRAEEPPENLVDLDIPETSPGETPLYPSPADGFYPVRVETGLSDSYNVEIKSGLQGDEEVFVQYLVEYAWG